MEFHVFAAVLVAAVCHASWNALLKVRLEPLTSISLMMAAGGLATLPFAFIVDFPDPRAWPYITASIAIHLVYYLALTEAYRGGDLAQVYPIARGAAPLITAIGAYFFFGESLDPWSITGIALLTVGVTLLSLRGGRDFARFDGRTVGFAMLTALSIAGYTLVDGQGARQSSSATSYIVWLFILDGLFMLAFIFFWRERSTVSFALLHHWQMLGLGGVLSAVAYAIVIWAMTVAPIALVSAVRESSVLVAAMIGVFVLKEPARYSRVVAAVLVVTGLVVLRLH